MNNRVGGGQGNEGREDESGLVSDGRAGEEFISV